MNFGHFILFVKIYDEKNKLTFIRFSPFEFKTGNFFKNILVAIQKCLNRTWHLSFKDICSFNLIQFKNHALFSIFSFSLPFFFIISVSRKKFLTTLQLMFIESFQFVLISFNFNLSKIIVNIEMIYFSPNFQPMKSKRYTALLLTLSQVCEIIGYLNSIRSN